MSEDKSATNLAEWLPITIVDVTTAGKTSCWNVNGIDADAVSRN